MSARSMFLYVALAALQAGAARPAPKHHAVGKITVKTYDAKPYDEPAHGPKLMRTHVTETFSGDIEADGVVEFLQVVQSDGSTSFVGIERVTGKLGGRTGTFVLQDAGTVSGKVVAGTWFVVPGSGTGQLTGLRGKGGFTADLGKSASITLDYSFE
ncbi:MAG: DUF3224 domain-containing protein [bacterium]